jgi:solute carrier family 25 (mitochondrial phosphate transporter), member 23/24/25/41
MPAETPVLPVDHLSPDVSEDDSFEEYDVEEEHHNWLEGHSAIKFLAAGGIAGAGEQCTSFSWE